MVWVDCPTGMHGGSVVRCRGPPPRPPPTETPRAPRKHAPRTRTHPDRMSPSWQPDPNLTSGLSNWRSVAHSYAMRRVLDADWEPTVPALVQMLAATAGPRLRAAFAAAGLDG